MTDVRRHPPFLFNALNALAALAKCTPYEIPPAAGRLRHFLRASFDQHEQAMVPLEEELAVIHAYLDIESLRLGNRLTIEEEIDPVLTEVLTPPFSLQPLVENAVQHGLQSSANAGRLRLAVRVAGKWLEVRKENIDTIDAIYAHVETNEGPGPRMVFYNIIVGESASDRVCRQSAQ